MRKSSFTILIAFLGLACQNEFLSVKPDKSMLVPETLTELRELIDNSSSVMNFTPTLTFFASDDVFIASTGIPSLLPQERTTYRWEERIYELGSNILDWRGPYQQVLYSNVVLDALLNIDPQNTNGNEYNEIKGTALFSRAFAFYNVAQQFCKPYNSVTAGTDLGIPIRVTSDINQITERATIEETYSQIINDLKEALPLLPIQVGYKTRPSKASAWSLLARIYLLMGYYQEAHDYADSTLALTSDILDYNDLDETANYPIPPSLGNSNLEVIYHSIIYFTANLTISANTGVPDSLYNDYSENDLRKALFFNIRPTGVKSFKGSYSGNFRVFSGITTVEICLIRAECNIRLGNPESAVKDLNTIREKRWRRNTFVPIESGVPGLLDTILTERRKELVFRGIRYSELRRLNQEPEHSTTLIRNFADGERILSPNDSKYTFPIPEEVIQETGIAQNERH